MYHFTYQKEGDTNPCTLELKVAASDPFAIQAYKMAVALLRIESRPTMIEFAPLLCTDHNGTRVVVLPDPVVS